MAAFGGGEHPLHLIGLDSSQAMLTQASTYVHEQLQREGKKEGEGAANVTFQLGNIAEWRAAADAPVDLLFSNAALQWLPDHLPLLSHLLAQLPSGGILANQIPSDFDQPSHTLMHDIAHAYTQRHLIPPTVLPRLSRTAAHVQDGGLRRYYDHLLPLCRSVDCWSTEYLQTVSCPVGDHPVAHFLSGSSLNQWLMEMPEGVREEMRAEYVRRVGEVYRVWSSVGEDGKEEVTCCFPFKRFFMVAVKK